MMAIRTGEGEGEGMGIIEGSSYIVRNGGA